MTFRGGKHPLFVRLEQREQVFRSVQPNVLVLTDRAGDDLNKFISLFKASPEAQIAGFAECGKVFKDLFVSLATDDSVSLLLAFIDTLFDIDYKKTIDVLVPYEEELVRSCKAKLDARMTEIQGPRAFVFRTLVLLLGALVSEPSVTPTDERYGAFMGIVKGVLERGDVGECQSVLEGLKRFLRCGFYRDMFVSQGCVSNLVGLVTGALKCQHTDTLYHVLFCIWELTYSPEGAAALSENVFVEILAKLLSTIQPEREEIVRLLTAIIGHLATGTVFVENAFDNDILRLFRSFQGKHYVDSDLNKEIATAAETLNQGLKKLSLWDKYVREVQSGVLRFTLSHKSEIFWKANIERFGENRYAILDSLKKLLASSDETTVCVACHDLGEYATRSPIGRVKLEEIGAKDEVMRLLVDPRAAIQREALRTTQLLLLRNQSTA